MILDNARSIDLHLDRCLNQRHFRAACDHCVKVCPAGAIKQDHGQVAIISEECTGCGLCLQECPAEVFTTRKWDESFALDALPESGVNRVELFCDRHSRSDADENSHCIQVPVCLGAMSRGIWFQLGMKCEVLVRLDECQECSMASAAARINNAVEYANEWLQACGYDANIICVERVNHAIEKTRRSAVSAGERRMSRRNFFLSFYKTAVKTVSNSIPDIGMNSSVEKKRKVPPHIPKWMRNLARAYPQEVPVNGEQAYWPYIEVNKACGACDACTDYCPTGALSSEVVENSYRKYFVPGLCLDCRICMETCPRHAITRSQKAVLLPFEKKKVFESPIESCSRCGGVALSRNHKGLCYWCAEEPPLDHLLHDVRRFVFSEGSSS